MTDSATQEKSNLDALEEATRNALDHIEHTVTGGGISEAMRTSAAHFLLEHAQQIAETFSYIDEIKEKRGRVVSIEPVP